MTIYEKAKSLVTAREAAEHYGLTVNRYGMALCPFHDDHNPSMKLDDRFHCFGCGEDGDVIDFTAKLFQLTLREAAEKLIEDFGNGEFIPDAPSPPKPPDPAKRCHDVLLDLEVRLHRQKRETAPQSMDDPITTEYAQNEHGRSHHNGIRTELPDVRFYRRSGRFAFQWDRTGESGSDLLLYQRRAGLLRRGAAEGGDRV